MIQQFDTFIARHGEVVAQAILENLERYEGVRSSVVTSLEERWERLIEHNSGRFLAA
ncbi:MAG: hypothetical protein AB7H77_06940 [Bdellovibrionales bacterium]